MVDTPGAEEEASRPHPQILRELSGLSGGPAPPELSMAANLAGQSLGRQINAVLHDKGLQRIEATWRGLQFLVDRTDFRQNISVEIMHVGRDELAEVFHRDVFAPECERSTKNPLSLVVADFELDKIASDVAMLTSGETVGRRAGGPNISP